ncbi:MAG: tryptophan synthase subunit alpha [Gammaproteobacteria bacterium]|nr:tryptophan synthase subunit alpha [Gammaproteobacteria bacterium]
MNRLATTFNRLRNSGEKGLITFITAGDPTLAATVPALRHMADAGADVLELGVPFTDPEADGASIQRSSERALVNGVTLRKTCEQVAIFRRENEVTPVVLMGYLNPILALGLEPFAQLASQSGVDGLIIVNLPPEEADELKSVLERVNIDLILLIAPTTPLERIKTLATSGSGFLYYVSIKGTTGADHLDVSDVERKVASIKKVTDLPVSVGFGIKTPEAAAAIAKVADAVVVGSALVETLGSATALEHALTDIHGFTSALKRSIRAC